MSMLPDSPRRIEFVRNQDAIPPEPERWPMSAAIRAAIITATLQLCELEVTGEGKVVRIVPTDASSRPSRRIRLSAMRMLADFDKLAIEQQKVDLLANSEPPREPIDRPDISSEAAYQCLKRIAAGDDKSSPPPEPPPPKTPSFEARLLQERWALSMEARGAVVESAVQLCGFQVGGDGAVESILDLEGPRDSRIKIGALRLLARFSRMSIEQNRLDRFRLAKPPEPKVKVNPRPNLHPAVAAEMDAIIKEFRRDLEGTRLAGRDG